MASAASAALVSRRVALSSAARSRPSRYSRRYVESAARRACTRSTCSRHSASASAMSPRRARSRALATVRLARKNSDFSRLPDFRAARSSAWIDARSFTASFRRFAARAASTSTTATSARKSSQRRFVSSCLRRRKSIRLRITLSCAEAVSVSHRPSARVARFSTRCLTSARRSRRSFVSRRIDFCSKTESVSCDMRYSSAASFSSSAASEVTPRKSRLISRTSLCAAAAADTTSRSGFAATCFSLNASVTSRSCARAAASAVRASSRAAFLSAIVAIARSTVAVSSKTRASFASIAASASASAGGGGGTRTIHSWRPIVAEAEATRASRSPRRADVSLASARVSSRGAVEPWSGASDARGRVLKVSSRRNSRRPKPGGGGRYDLALFLGGRPPRTTVPGEAASSIDFFGRRFFLWGARSTVQGRRRRAGEGASGGRSGKGGARGPRRATRGGCFVA